MTNAIYSIVALELGEAELGATLFNMSYQRFNFPPYYTWSEKQDGTGNVPYLTSGAGFLQAVTYGYAGIRALAGRLRLQPQLIEGVERMALRRLQYCGTRIDLEYNTSVASVMHAYTTQESERERVKAARLRVVTVASATEEGAALPTVFPTGQVAYLVCH